MRRFKNTPPAHVRLPQNEYPHNHALPNPALMRDEAGAPGMAGQHPL